MPQLNPSPWFAIMLISWLTLSAVIQPKLLSFSPIAQPTHKTPTLNNTSPWTWPWT